MATSMKTSMKSLLAVAALILFAASAARAGDPAPADPAAAVPADPAAPDAGDIVAVIQSKPLLSVLVKAATKAALIDALKAAGPYTVFGPVDEAFAAKAGEMGITADKLLENPDLAKILKYHVVNGKIMASDITEEEQCIDTLAEGLQLCAKKMPDGKVMVGPKGAAPDMMAEVVMPDLDATNGVIHEIQKVLMPPDAEPEPAATP